MRDGDDIAPSRRRGLERVRDTLLMSQRVVLTTHVNADGDGAGSETAVGLWLRRQGVEPIIVNPTRFPEEYAFLLEGLEARVPSDDEGRRAIEEADAFLVLDTSEPSRIGELASRIAGARVIALDHHPEQPDALGDPAVRDPAACATGELAYELIALRDRPTLEEARGLYVAIVTDTGSFRFSNTTARAHRIAARLVEAGVDPEAMYRRLYGRLTPARLALLRRALASLTVDGALPIAWITLTRRDMEETEASSEDLDGVVEYARRLQGIEVALLVRELPGGRTKASLRSNGAASVADVARAFGGGGHEKAAGALLDRPLEEALEAILERTREEVRRLPTVEETSTPPA